MNEQYSALRSNVSMLGKVLGDTIKDALGENILDRVETIRKLSKSSRAGNEANRQELLTTLQNLSNDELLPVARAFSQFLNLANTAEQYHSISPNGEAASNPEVIARTLRKLKDQPNLNEDTIKKRWNPVAGAGADRPPDRDHPPYADPQNGGSEQLPEAAG
jgi:phosphoenolpyruvate carboxylase